MFYPTALLRTVCRRTNLCYAVLDRNSMGECNTILSAYTMYRHLE